MSEVRDFLETLKFSTLPLYVVTSFLICPHWSYLFHFLHRLSGCTLGWSSGSYSASGAFEPNSQEWSPSMTLLPLFVLRSVRSRFLSERAEEPSLGKHLLSPMLCRLLPPDCLWHGCYRPEKMLPAILPPWARWNKSVRPCHANTRWTPQRTPGGRHRTCLLHPLASLRFPACIQNVPYAGKEDSQHTPKTTKRLCVFSACGSHFSHGCDEVADKSHGKKDWAQFEGAGSVAVRKDRQH